MPNRLPMPGAIGTFCGTGSPYGGDSAVLAASLQRPGSDRDRRGYSANPYMSGVEATNVLGYPLTSPALLAKFPPTLHLAGSRDFACQCVVTLSHRKLLARGVDSQLVLFDGLGHAFFMRADLPESQEAYAIIWRFFDARLGRR